MLNKKRDFYPYFLILPAIVLLLALFVYPYAYNIYLSLNNWRAGFHSPEFIGLGNFKELLIDNPSSWNAISVSLRFTFIGVAVEFVLGLGIALLFDSLTRGKKFFRTIIVIPMAITPIVASLTWKTLMYDTTFGVLNYLFSSIGLGKLQWLGSVEMALASVIIVEVWHWTPFLVILFIAGLSSLPRENYEAAYVDGATGIQMFRFITFPLLIPITFIGVIFRMMDAFRTFDVIYALTGGGPGTITQAMPLYIFQTTFEYFHFGSGAAASFVIILISLFIVTVLYSLYRHLKKDIA